MKRLLATILLGFAGFAHARVPAFFSHVEGMRVVVVAYHSGDQTGCTYETNAMLAFASDLETAYQHGWKVIPAQWAAEWAAGKRDLSESGTKFIAFTFDDGDDQDWYDGGPVAQCPDVPGAYTILSRFSQAHPGYFVHATSFVIASETARARITYKGVPYLHSDWWWWAENASRRLMSVENHSADHDHDAIDTPVWAPELRTNLRAASIEDNDWSRKADFAHVRTWLAADIEVRRAADFIGGKTGRRPTLFSCPYSQMSEYLRKEYFPRYASEHGMYAAFCSRDRPIRQGDDLYFLSRYGYGKGSSWNTPEGFLAVVLGESPQLRLVDTQ